MSQVLKMGKPPKVVFGAMTIGKPNTLGARVHTLEDATGLLDAFQKYGHDEVDTARGYGNGTTEEMLAGLGWQQRKLMMGTKLYPTAVVFPDSPESYTHQAEDVRRGLFDSLKALGADDIDLFYLHGPDRKTPFEETLREVDKLHREGYFRRFGLSNYMSWEVAQICEICDRYGWIKPTVYQGMYNALQRTVEAELVPCLRKYGIALYSFQPLAAGFLTGRYIRDEAGDQTGTRFDPKSFQGANSRARYWKDEYFNGLDIIRDAAQPLGLTVAEVALRWLKHHSQLSGDLGDAIIIGGSNAKHIDDNLLDLEKGPLPENVVQAVDKAWAGIKGTAPIYWH